VERNGSHFNIISTRLLKVCNSQSTVLALLFTFTLQSCSIGLMGGKLFPLPIFTQSNVNLDGASTYHSNANSVTWGGVCEDDKNIFVTGTDNTSFTCSSGTWTYIVNTQTTDALYSYTFTQEDPNGNHSSIILKWQRDTTQPTVSSVVINNNDTSTSSNFIQITTTTSDSFNNITHFCIKYNDNTLPTVIDSCWIPVNNPSPGLTPSTTINISNYFYQIGLGPGTYSVYVWVKDVVGNISDLSASGAGTLGQDKDTIDFLQNPPPQVLNVLVTGVDDPSDPPTAGNLTILSGLNTYIKWKATDDVALPANPISLYYTTDDTNYTLIANSLTNSANGACTVDHPGTTADDGSTGCYFWTSPTSAYFKVKVVATDSSSVNNSQTSTYLNLSNVSFLAGNTDLGLGNSAASAIFINYESAWSDVGNFVVTRQGKVFFRDIKRGILYIDPADGIQQLLIPETGTSSGDGGPVSSATINKSGKMALDYDDNIILWDYNLIRKINTSVSPMTIDTIIGGGGSLADPETPLNFQVPNHGEFGNNTLLVALPNGRIYFQENILKLRYYDPGDGLIHAISLSGSGGSYAENYTVSFSIPTCNITLLGLNFNLITSQVYDLIAGTSITTAASCGGIATRTWRGQIRFNPTTGVAEGPHPVYISTEYTAFNYKVHGMDGEMYLIHPWARIEKYDRSTRQWNVVVGSGSNGVCPDGTAALSCNSHINDAFISETGKIYFVDRGTIRTVGSDGNIVTFYGQRKSFGVGVKSLSARFGNINFIKQMNSGEIIVFDEAGAQIKKFARNGNISLLAGDGNVGTPTTGVDATTQPLIGGPWGAPKGIELNPVNGDIYMDGSGKIIKLNASNGQWEDLITALGNGSAPRVIGFNGTDLMSINFSHYGADGDKLWMKLYDIGTTAITSLLGTGTKQAVTDYCTDGTLGSACDFPIYTDPSSTYDAISDQWYLLKQGKAEIRKISTATIETTGVGTLVTLPRSALSFVYRRISAAPDIEMIYYCSSNERKLYKYNINTSTETALSWAVSSINCAGRSLIYDSAQDTLIFPYIQNDLYGIAEYLSPGT